jgi:hypothetical protein
MHDYLDVANLTLRNRTAAQFDVKVFKGASVPVAPSVGSNWGLKLQLGEDRATYIPWKVAPQK